MEHNEAAADDAGGKALVATHRVEAVVATILLVFGAVIAVESYKLGAGWTSDGPGAGYFPFYIGLILAIASAGTLVLSLVGKDRNTEGFVDREQLKRVLQVLLPAVVYVLVVNYLGLYVASAIYIALFMVLLGHYPWIKSVVIGVVVNALMFVMFEVWFKVPLFKGQLDPLAFLGY